MRRTPLAAVLLVAGLALAGCATTTPAQTAASSSATAMTDDAGSDEMATDDMGSDSATDEMDDAAMAAGAYLTVEEYGDRMAERSGTTVVYFFHADWCPSCRATEESLTTAGVPEGLTVVKVDYDTATDLKRQYGITQQHTFVHVDTDGSALSTWTGSVTGDEIKAQATGE